MMGKSFVFLVVLISIISGTSFAAQNNIAGEFDSYVFSLSWQPTFCTTKPDKQECQTQTPDRYDAKNLALHGLWPNKNDDKQHRYGFCDVPNSIKKLDKASTWCKMPAFDLSDTTKKNLSIYMPGYASCLQNHEWYKHGTCSGLDSDTYFSTASTIVDKVATSTFGKFVTDNVGNTVSSDDFLAAFESAFGEGSGKSVTLHCINVAGESALSEVRMYFVNPLPVGLDIKEMLTQPGGSKSSDCPQQFSIPKVPSAIASTAVTTKQPSALMPLVKNGQPVDWWFAFKFNSATFPECGGTAERDCRFGGTVQDYKSGYSQQYVFASSQNPSLQKGDNCVGDTLEDPLGATFNQVYNSKQVYYVVWNDQFYGDPAIAGCSQSCSSPWGHSKGMIAWNDSGDGFVLQVSTPSWPASGNMTSPRMSDGNTLGCITNNNTKFSQHFFALKLNRDDLVAVLKGLKNASVVTDPNNKQIVRNGGPSDIQQLVYSLGMKSNSTTYLKQELSTGIILLSKPSQLHVPAWQFVSANLDSTPLRAATWWAPPQIPTTTVSTPVDCWDGSLGKPGAVEIATSGTWGATTIGLKGGPQPDGNHAKVGVSTDKSRPFTIFGDLNQQGALSDKCSSSQNGRGGTFYILKDKALFESMSLLLNGGTAEITQ